MSRFGVLRMTWPVLSLSALLMTACLASIAYIGHLQEDLVKSVRSDFDRLQAAQNAQIHLREFRVHTVVLAAEPTAARQALVEADRVQIRVSLELLRATADSPADQIDLSELEDGWTRYQAGLDREENLRPRFRTVADLAQWADAHRVGELLKPSGRIVLRSEERMAQTSEQTKTQAAWATRGLLTLGLIGPLAGVFGGYALARGISRRVAQLSLHIRAVQTELDQDIGSVTVERFPTLGDLDVQLEQVVHRVQVVCRRVQEQERDLLRAEQLAAVGHLAAGVAHEVRNPLTGIKMLIEAAARKEFPTPLTQHDLELIAEEISRMERTVQGLLDYAKETPSTKRPCDVRGSISRACAIVAPRAKRAGVSVEEVVGEVPLLARIDPDQFVSLISNLLINALDVTESGGRISLEANSAPDKSVRIAVRDHGPGIPPGQLDTLFTPFATTKPTGTGLGLAVARQVAIDHGGSLSAANADGGGACFTVTIPGTEDTRDEATRRG